MESSVKSVILKESQTVPSSFISCSNPGQTTSKATMKTNMSLAQLSSQNGIKASVICPGPVATRMRASNHPGEDPAKIMKSQDIADVALFLVTQPKRAYIGEVVVSVFPT